MTPSVCLVVAAYLSGTAILNAPEAVALSATDEWNTAAQTALPAHIKVWLGLMMLTNLAAIGFLKNHVAARWVFGGFILSHGLVMVMVMWAMEHTILAGQISLFHIIFWTPGAFMLLRRRHEIQNPSAYAVWATLSLIFYFGSMVVDVRDAARFVQYTLVG
ncbi:MAG: hypothetical protein AAF642_10705 [Pseudomonadota bacterium]